VVSALWIFRYTPPIRDTQRTFRLSGPRAQGPSSACEQQQERALLAHFVQVVGDLVTLATAFMMTVSGFVEGVSRAFLREQTISELFSKEGDAYNGMQRIRAVSRRRLLTLNIRGSPLA
jgi:hypothetical protein